ncbi:EAL domain-containing protein [Corallincola luteus]|uniref:EAL domain-containing protein n=1 Tax=Corallincola luteus TaxID=1775177 RepID=A0ABY2AMX6_9GAMM|nr:EAL domain-containing protein [Corallincola luteus]TCI04559.1 EAL domain-containing protein [Corallincola luteus]
MSLTRRLFTLLAMICLPALLFLWIASRGLLLDTLQRIEHMVAENHLRQTYNQFEFYLQRLETWGFEWSQEPDLVKYVVTPSKAFETGYFPDDLLVFNRSHLVMFFDADVSVLFERFIDTDSDLVNATVPANIKQKIQHRIQQQASELERKTITGMVQFDHAPMMLTIRAIRPLDDANINGTTTGYLVFAERVDAQLLFRISQAMGYSVNLQPHQGPQKLQSLNDTQLDRTQSSLWVTRTLYGLDHDTQFELSISMDRSLFLFGAEGIERYLVITICSLLALLAALYLFIRQYVAAPVASLTRQVNAIDADAEECQPIIVGKSREIKILGEKFNRLMDSLFKEKVRARTTLASIGEAVISTDSRGSITYLSPVAEKLLQLTQEQGVGLPIDKVLQSVDGMSLAPQIAMFADMPSATTQRSMRRLQIAGRSVSIEQTVSPLLGAADEITGAVLVLRDISSAELLKEKLQHQSSHDPVTGLYTRGRFEQMISLLSPELTSGEHAVCYIDLDNFKLVNDNCGHGVGDRLLREISDAIRRCIRETDLLARMGGDEFALVLRDIDIDAVRKVMVKISEEIESVSVYWGASAYSVGASIGVSFLRPEQTQLKAVLQEADAACRGAKLPGSNNICFYDADNQEVTDHQQAPRWAIKINDAIDADKLELFYQEIMPLAPTTEGMKRIEVLVRMREANGELLLPDSFLPAAERYHLCEKLDHWVLEHVYQWLARHPECWSHSRVSINLSTETLGSDKFEPYLASLCHRYRIPNSSICFEITERAAIRNQQKMIELLKRLRNQGFRFALDDFGSGFSSYGYLKSLPVDFVKIDGGFVRTMHEDPKDLALVQSIHQVCNVLGMQTVAEYVENDAVYQSACDLGIDFVQGFNIGHPKPLSEFALNFIDQQVV